MQDRLQNNDTNLSPLISWAFLNFFGKKPVVWSKCYQKDQNSKSAKKTTKKYSNA